MRSSPSGKEQNYTSNKTLPNLVPVITWTREGPWLVGLAKSLTCAQWGQRPPSALPDPCASCTPSVFGEAWLCCQKSQRRNQEVALPVLEEPLLQPGHCCLPCVRHQGASWVDWPGSRSRLRRFSPSCASFVLGARWRAGSCLSPQVILGSSQFLSLPSPKRLTFLDSTVLWALRNVRRQ